MADKPTNYTERAVDRILTGPCTDQLRGDDGLSGICASAGEWRFWRPRAFCSARAASDQRQGRRQAHAGAHQQARIVGRAWGVRGGVPAGPAGPRRRRRWQVLLHPLTVICAVQAACSLSLVWSNTAFTDEADYLRLGHLILANWLHGKSWPATYGQKIVSGSPFIYPPIGAMADSLGGLAAARILSLAFLLAATVLLYSAARRLLGPTEAAIAAALWALSEPVIRLAFATYDPISVFLAALAAWLAVQAGYRNRHAALVAACAAALALSTATAYSGLVIDPVLLAFAFLVWLPRRGIRRACYSTAWLAGAWLVFFTLLITASRSWPGIAFTVINRQVDDYQSAQVILIDVLAYSGLIIVVALTAAVIAVRAETGPRRALLVLLGGTALVVPAAQFYVRTGWALDKHRSIPQACREPTGTPITRPGSGPVRTA